MGIPEVEETPTEKTEAVTEGEDGKRGGRCQGGEQYKLCYIDETI